METMRPSAYNYGSIPLVKILELFVLSNSAFEFDALSKAFFDRLKIKFYDRCQKAVYKLYKHDPHAHLGADDLFQETFITVLDKIKQFKFNEDWDEGECQKVVLNWMGEIANRKILKGLKKEKEEKEEIEKYFYYRETETRAGAVAKRKYEPTYDKEKFTEGWEKLNPMSKELLLKCAVYNTLTDGNSKHLPDDVIKELCERYNVQPATLRQAKSRAIAMLKNCKI